MLKRPRLSPVEMDQLRRGVELFNRGAYWDSHEVWEEIWQQHGEAWRLFLQGLIQTAAALHQHQRGIFHGAVKHLHNARWKLALFPDVFLGIDNLQLQHDVYESLRRIECAGPQRMRRLELTWRIAIKEASE